MQIILCQNNLSSSLYNPNTTILIWLFIKRGNIILGWGQFCAKKHFLAQIKTPQLAKENKIKLEYKFEHLSDLPLMICCKNRRPPNNRCILLEWIKSENLLPLKIKHYGSWSSFNKSMYFRMKISYLKGYCFEWKFLMRKDYIFSNKKFQISNKYFWMRNFKS